MKSMKAFKWACLILTIWCCILSVWGFWTFKGYLKLASSMPLVAAAFLFWMYLSLRKQIKEDEGELELFDAVE